MLNKNETKDYVGLTFGNDPGPSDGKAVVGHGHVLDQLHVLPVVVITVAGHLAGGSVICVGRVGSERVPNAGAFAILIPGSFNL
jgi:hypothetical protein